MVLLVDLPPEVLDGVLQYQLPVNHHAPVSSNPVVQLWQCGSVRLNHKIRVGCTSIILMARRVKPSPKIPSIVYQLENLRIFKLWSVVMPDHLSLGLFAAPYKLTYLQLGLPDFGLFSSVVLDALLPNLQTLELLHSRNNFELVDGYLLCTKQSPTFDKTCLLYYLRLPNTLTKLVVFDLNLTSVYQELPVSLQHFDYMPQGTTNQHVTTLLQNSKVGCPNLVTLKGCRYNPGLNYAELQTLPSSLKRIAVGIDAKYDHTAHDISLPTMLESLEFVDYSTSLTMTNYELMRYFPRTLTSLVIRLYRCPPVKLSGSDLKAILPPNLIEFQLRSIYGRGDSLVDWDTITPASWPSKLSIMNISASTSIGSTTEHLAERLPSTLTDLCVVDHGDTYAIGQLILPSSHFTSLTRLQIILYHHCVDMTTVQLPQSLTHLGIYCQKSTPNMCNVDWSTMCPRLTSLELSSADFFGQMLGDMAHLAFPTTLKHLKIRTNPTCVKSCRLVRQFMLKLPRTLERLSIRHAMLKWAPTCLFEVVPFRLTHLSLQIHSYGYEASLITANWRQHLAKRTTLQRLKLDLNLSITPNELPMCLIPTSTCRLRLTGIKLVFSSTTPTYPYLHACRLSHAFYRQNNCFAHFDTPCLKEICYV